MSNEDLTNTTASKATTDLEPSNDQASRVTDEARGKGSRPAVRGELHAVTDEDLEFRRFALNSSARSEAEDLTRGGVPTSDVNRANHRHETIDETYILNDETARTERLIPDDQALVPLSELRRGYGDAYGDAYGYGYGYGDNQALAVNLRAVLGEVWRSVRTHPWMIIAITVIVTLIVFVEMERIRPTYTASTMVEIKKEAHPLLLPVSDADPENVVGIKTKILMFSSRPLLEDVVRQLRLDQNPKFMDMSAKKSRWDAIVAAVRLERHVEQPAITSNSSGKLVPIYSAQSLADGQPGSQQIEDKRLDRYISVLESCLKVEHIRETQALKISVTHHHPLIAADLANGLAQSFIKASFQDKTEKITNTSRALDRSTIELKERMRQAEEALGRYSQDHNIVSPSQIRLPADRLLRLHDQYMRASGELVVKESLYDEVRQGRGSQLPDSFTDSRIVEQQRRLNELSLQASQLSLTYGPENPRVEEVREQVARLREQLAESRKSLDEKVKADYERGLQETQTFKQLLSQAKSEASLQDQASIQYNILKQDADTARALYNEFLRKASEAGLEAVEQQSNVSVIRPARVPQAPDGLDPELVVLLAFLLSSVGGVGLAFAIEKFDDTIKSVNDVNCHVQLATLGVIPTINTNSRRLLPLGRARASRIAGLSLSGETVDTRENGNGNNSYFLRFLPAVGSSNGAANLISVDERSSIAEAYRSFRTSLLLSVAGNPAKTILFASGRPGEGKTSTVINTAISLAQLGSSVLIIDADLRKPATHERFRMKSQSGEPAGLSTYLSDNTTVLESTIQKLPVPGLSLLPCGPIPPNPAELISTPKMKEVLRVLSERYDYLLIDSPPLLHVTDAVILSTQVNGVILVVQAAKSQREAVRHCRQLVTNVGGKVLGVVLNKVNLGDHAYRDSFNYPTKLSYRREGGKGRISDILT